MNAIANELAAWGRKVAERGFVAGTGGNLSVRDGARFWIKPAGAALAELSGKDLASVDLETGAADLPRLRPSSEFRLHRAIYLARPDAGAVFHTHSPWATGLASAGIEIRPMIIETVGYLGRIAALPYLLTSTPALAERAAEAARDHDTLLLANHGVVVIARTMREAFHRCEVVESSAQAVAAASAVGKPQYLSAERIAELESLGKPPTQ